MRLTFPNGHDFVTALKVIAGHASTDETRPHLNGVHFEVRAESIDVVATDGHRLGLYRFLASTYECDETGPAASVDLPLASVLAFVKGAKTKAKDVRPVVLDTTAGTLEYEDTSVRFPANRGIQFPPYVQILPESFGTSMCAIDAHYIADAAKAFDAFKRPSCPIHIHAWAGDGYGPITFLSPAVPELLVIVMPMRSDFKGFAPKAMAYDLTRLPACTSAQKETVEALDQAAE